MKFYLATPEVFLKYANDAYYVIFNQESDYKTYKSDNYLVALDDNDEFMGFVGYYEISPKHVYLTAGGIVPKFRGALSLKYFESMLSLLNKYDIIEAKVRNINYAMLRLYLKLQFNIIGTTTYNNNIWLTLVKGVQHGN